MVGRKVGLVLSGGGTRGLSHVGALKVLDRLPLQFSAVAGCSIGAIVGALYAAGRSPIEIETFILTQKLTRLFSLSRSRLALTDISKLEQQLESFLPVEDFHDLRIPLYINATNLTTQRVVVFSAGPLLPAIRASIILPGLMKPAEIDGDLYVDGGILDEHPLSILPKDVTRAIIVDASPPEPLWPGSSLNAITVLRASVRLMQAELTRLRLKDIDPNRYVRITPDVSRRSILEREGYFRDIIDRGEAAATAALPEIERKILTR